MRNGDKLEMMKTILITGCSSGIGHVAAHELKKRGYRIFATCRHLKDVQRLKTEGFEEVYPLDLSSSDSIHEAVQWVLSETGGKLYALFNNGAYGQPGAVEDLTRTAIRQQFEVNVFGTMELTNLLIPAMREQQDARIIQNSSVLGLITMPYRGAYAASKFALEGLSDTLRMELKNTSIKVSLIEPGPIVTKFRDNALTALKQEIDVDNSIHSHVYKRVIARLQKKGPAVPFTLEADAVVKKLVHALESSKPKARYYVTIPTYVFAYLKKVLPTSMMDFILSRHAE